MKTNQITLNLFTAALAVALFAGATRIQGAFILPALIGFLVFMVWPTLRGIYLSFTKFNLLTPPEFNGLDNPPLPPGAGGRRRRRRRRSPGTAGPPSR